MALQVHFCHPHHNALPTSAAFGIASVACTSAGGLSGSDGCESAEVGFLYST